jgi:hypothetical protein
MTRQALTPIAAGERLAGPRRGAGIAVGPVRAASLALLAWSMLYALIHLYWGLGGDYGLFALKPSAPEEDIWIAANLFAFGLIAFAGGLGFALERARRLPARAVLLAIVAAGSAIATSHGVYGIAFRAAQVAGLSSIEGAGFSIDDHGWALWDMLAIEPWFLVEGLLLGVVGYLNMRSTAGRDRWLLAVSGLGLIALLTGVLGLKFA